jgi:hypothetical protein
MAVITIGTDTTGINLFGLGNTALSTGTSSGTGTINSVTLKVSTTLGGVLVGTFYLVSGNIYRMRGSATIGTVSAGTQTLTGLSIPVVAGDYIGIYFTSGYLYFSPSGGNSFVCPGSAFTGADITYYPYAYTFGITGVGATLGLKINGITYSKWNGTTITKINNL